MAAHLLRHRIRDEVERIRGPRVLGERFVVQIDDAGDRIVHDILEDRAEPVRAGVDLRLGLRGELDHLRVAPAFEVEDTVVAPPVLVVADQPASGIGGQRGLAGAGETEEEGRVAVRTDVRRAVHRHHRLQREEIVQDREDRFLDLAGVARVADDAELLGEVHAR